MAYAARLAVLLLVGSLALGCFVLEELDHAKQLSSGPGSAKPSPRDEEPPPKAEPPSGPNSIERLQAWWAKRQQAARPPRHPDDAMVRCRSGGRTWYTHKRDCLAGGGTPELASSAERP
jgi:hypothetical protein